MLEFSAATSSQIRFLLQRLTESNAQSTLKQLLDEFIDYGSERTSLILLTTCLDHFDISQGKDFENQPLRLVLSSVFKHLLDKPYFTTTFCECLKTRDVNQVFLHNISNLFNLSTSQRIAVGLALSESENLDATMSMCGKNFCISQIENLCAKPVSVDSNHKIRDVIMFLKRSDGLSKHLDSFMQMLSSVQLKLLRRQRMNENMSHDESLDNDFDSILAEIEKKRSMVYPDFSKKNLPLEVSILFVEWNRICGLPGDNQAEIKHFILQLQDNGLLEGDKMTGLLFRLLTEYAVACCLSSEVMNSDPYFLAIDIHAKLVFFIMKECGTVPLLSRILEVTVGFVEKDAEEKKTSFKPSPYFRLFFNLLADIGSLEPNIRILTAFANAFHGLRPLKIPAFSYAWLELISQRSFMPNMLIGNIPEGWSWMQRLLVDIFEFMEPFLRNAELQPPVHFLYKGTLRVLLVLCHDFPEFICHYHFTFCDVIPPSCIQMRNIILSAFPRNMSFLDPSNPNLKIWLVPEIYQSPRILSEVDGALKSKQMKAQIDEYLRMRQHGSSFLSGLKQKLVLPPREAACAGTGYDVPLMNSLVLYVGMQDMPTISTVTLAVFETLTVELDTEGRYLFLNAVANQLRYPNTHTYYFSLLLLYLFAESHEEIIQEQISRVLLERLIVERPHPWGLVITFIELIKNPRYNLRNRPFIRCEPDIERRFEWVSRSLGV